MPIPTSTTHTTAPVAATVAHAGGNAAAMKTVEIKMIVGQRPLHSIRLFDRIAQHSFARRLDDAAGDDAGGVAAEAHRHRQRLLAVSAGPAEEPIEIERDARQVAHVLEPA